MELFKLMGTIAVNNSEANQNIDDTTGKVEGFGSKLLEGIGTVAQWSAAIVAGSAAAVGGLVAFAESSASACDTIDKMSQKIGISREAYQELDFICSQSGTSVDGLQAGMKSLTAAMDGAANGTAANVEQFDRLGVSVTNADGTFRSQEDVMWDTLEALQGVEDQTEKARLATELFGRSGTELMPLLNGEAGSIEEMREQAHELGLVLDDELIDSGVELTDSLDQTKRAFESIGIQLGGALMPIVTMASDYIQTMIPTIQSMVERLAPIITSLLEGLLPPLMNLCEQVFPILISLIETLLPPVVQIVQQLLPVIVQLIQILLPPILQIVQAVLPILVELINALLPVLQPILDLLTPLLDLVMAILEPLIALIGEILPPIIDFIVMLVDEIVAYLIPVIEQFTAYINENFSPLIEALKMLFSDVWEAIKLMVSDAVENMKSKFESFKAGIQAIVDKFNTMKTNITNVWNTVKSTISTTINTIKTNITTVFNSVKSTVTTIFNGVKTAITTPITTAKNTIKNIVDTIKGYFSGMSISFPNIKLPHFSVSPSGWTISKLLEGVIPSLGISWYAKGGVMDGATPFGLNGDQLMIGGEAGKEAIIPLEKDTAGIELIASKLQENMNSEMNLVIQDKMNQIINKLDELSHLQMITDTGALVGELAAPMDVALGSIYAGKGRGGRSKW